MARACLHGSRAQTCSIALPIALFPHVDVPILFLLCTPITLHPSLCPWSLQYESSLMRSIYIESHRDTRRDTENVTTQPPGPQLTSHTNKTAWPPNSTPLLTQPCETKTRVAEKEDCRPALPSIPITGVFTTASPPRVPLRTPRTAQRTK